MCGDEAAAVRQSLDIKYPVSLYFSDYAQCFIGTIFICTGGKRYCAQLGRYGTLMELYFL